MDCTSPASERQASRPDSASRPCLARATVARAVDDPVSPAPHPVARTTRPRAAPRARIPLAFAAALCLTACDAVVGAATGPAYNYETPVRVTVVPQALQLAPGEARALTGEVRNASGDALAAAVEWSADSAGIVEVSTTGEVRGLRAGTTRVIARA